MQEEILVAIIVNVVYLAFWYIFIKMRNSKNHIVKQWDNGYAFYSSLSETDKERYWKEDTKVLKIFLLLLLFFIEGTLFLNIVLPNTIYWIICLIIGLLISSIVAIVLSSKLQKKFK